MKKKWKGWLSLCLAFVLGFAIVPAAVSADDEFANLKLYTGSARVTSDMYVSDDIGKYAEDVNENCPSGYRRDGYRLWRLDESNYTVSSKWVSENQAEWPAYMTGYFATDNIILVPNWVPEYSAEPITAENPTVIIGDGSAQERGDFYYQWLHERKAVDIGNYHDESEQIKVSSSVNAVYNSEIGKWTAGNEQSYMELRLSLQRGDVVAVKNIGGGTNPQQYFSGYLKTSSSSQCLETYDRNNDVFYVTSMASGECSLHMQNNLNPNGLQVSVTVSRFEGEDGEVGEKTYSGEDGTYCCKVSYIKGSNSISFLTNSVTIKKNEPGGNEPGGNEPGGNEPGGNEPGGNEPGGNEPGGNEPGGNEPGGNEPGGNEPGGNEPGGDETQEYAINCTEAKNGSYAAKINGKEVDKALSGQTVTVETYPAAGYKTKIITYRKADDADGEQITVPMGGDGNGCFVMPAYDITLAVSFQKESSEETPVQPPRMEISLDGTEYNWQSFSGKVSFELIFNKAQQLKLKASEAQGAEGKGKVSYYLADKDLFSQDRNYTPQEIEEKIGGKWKDGASVVALKSDGRYVLYAKASDGAGNTTYANSQGIVIDTTAPVISGIKDGRDSYGTAKFTVKDDNLDTVTIDGKKAKPKKGKYTIQPDNAVHKIVATDLAGNKVSYKITVNETWVRDGIEKNGVYSLKKGTAYKLGKGKWKIVGDSTVYKGGTVIYVPDSGDYDFRKQ